MESDIDSIQFESSDSESPVPEQPPPPPPEIDKLEKARAFLQPEMFIARNCHKEKPQKELDGAYCGFCGRYLSGNMTLSFQCAGCGIQGRGTTTAESLISSQIGMAPVRRTPPL